MAICLEPVSGAEAAGKGGAARGAASRYAVTWPSAAGRVYTLYAVTNLMEGGVPSVVATLEGTGERLAVPMEHPEGAPVSFFRLGVALEAGE